MSKIKEKNQNSVYIYVPQSQKVERRHNRHRKDMPLTVEQIENLKITEGIIAVKFTEKEILSILRKKYKKNKLTLLAYIKAID